MTNDRSITVKYLKLAGKTFLLLAALYLSYRLLLLFMVLFAPFILAMLIALLMDRPVRYLEKTLRLSRNIATLLVLSGFSYVLVLLLVWVVGRLVAELTYFVSRMPHWQALLTEQGEMWLVVLQEYLAFLPVDFAYLPTVDATLAALAERLNTVIPVLLTALVGLASLVPTAVVFILILLVATFFVTVDLEKHKSRLLSLTPPGTMRPLLEVFARLLKATYGWIKTQLVMMGVTTVIVMVGLIILEVRFVMLLAVTVGIVDALPVLGPGAIFVPWILWAVLAGNMALAGGLAVLYATTLMARYALSPLILSENIGIEPLSTLVASYVGLILMGFLGLAMGPLLLVVYKALAEVGFVTKVKEWLFS